MARFLQNTWRAGTADPGGPAPSRAALELHRRLPGYAPTPLHDLTELARELGVGAVYLKDESLRLGLPAFKVLGASWAALRILERALGEDLVGCELEELRERLGPLRPGTLVAATDGNHGRAVATMARLLGFDARIFVPRGTDRARIDAIAGEGATVTEAGASYERTLEHAVAASQSEGAFLVQDVSWEGFEEVPRWVVEGYATMFWELEEQRSEQNLAPPDLVFVPIGGGMLASAVIAHFRRAGAAPTQLVGVEPESAACALAALEHGRVVEIECPHTSTLVGLNCGRLASSAWPLVKSGLDGTLALEEHWVGRAVRTMAKHGLMLGECGSAGLAGLLALLEDPAAAELRAHLGLGPETRVQLLATEGVTNPVSYRNWLEGG